MPPYVIGARRVRPGHTGAFVVAASGVLGAVTQAHSCGIYLSRQAPRQAIGIVGWPDQTPPGAADPLAVTDPDVAEGAGQYVRYALVREAQTPFEPVGAALVWCTATDEHPPDQALGWLTWALARERVVPGVSLVRLLQATDAPGHFALVAGCRDDASREAAEGALETLGPTPPLIRETRRFLGAVIHQWERSLSGWDDLAARDRSPGGRDDMARR